MNVFERVEKRGSFATEWMKRFRSLKAVRLYQVTGNFHAPYYRDGDMFVVVPKVKPSPRSHVAITVQNQGQVLGILADDQTEKVIIRVLNYSNSIYVLNRSSIVSMEMVLAGFHQ